MLAGRCGATHRRRKIAGSSDFTVALAGIAAVGLTWRVAYLVWMRHVPVVGDGIFYHYGAIYLVEGHGFVNVFFRLFDGIDIPNALHPPAWITVLALPSALGLRSYLSHQLFAAVIGTVTIVMTGVAGRAAFGRRTGLIAAALVAIDPNAWAYERELAVEVLAMAGVAVIIWLAYRYRARPSLRGAVALGAAAGVLAMTRSELITFTVILVMPLILSSSRVVWRARVAWLAMAGAACAVVIAPWAIYNSTRFDRPVPLTTSFGSAMLQGNCANTYSGKLLGYYEVGCAILRRDVSKDPSVADGQYRRIALDFMRAHKSRVPVVMAARVGRTFGFFRPFQQVHLDHSDRTTDLWVLRLGLFVYWALLPLGIAGVVIARCRGVPVYPLLVAPATVLLIAVITIGETRYRASAEIPLVILAAVALDAIARSGRRRSRRVGTVTPS